MPDGGTVHTIPVTPDTAPDPVAAAVAALIQHDATCTWCATNLNVPGAAICVERADLVAATEETP